MLDLWIFTSQKVFIFKIWFYQCQNFVKITNEQVEKLFLRVPRPLPARCSMNLVWKEVLIVSKGFVPCLLISCSTCSALCNVCMDQHCTTVIAKGQIISECPLEILDFPKIPRKIWQISALESKKWSCHKIKTLYNVFNTLNNKFDHMYYEEVPLSYDLTTF